MEKFITKIIEFASLGNWMFILFGVECLVFIFGIVMMIIKKKAFPVGTSTAVATLLVALTLPLIGQLLDDDNYKLFTLFDIAAGALLSVIGGVTSMIVSKKCKHRNCSQSVSDSPAPEKAPDYFNEPAPYDYSSDNLYSQPAPAAMPDYSVPPAPAPQYSAPVAVNSEVDALLLKINRICTNGASLPEMRETAMQLQKERAKPENKNNPVIYTKLNKSLLDLLNVIQKK